MTARQRIGYHALQGGHVRRLILLGFILLTATAAQGCKDKKKKGEHEGHRMARGDRGAPSGPSGSPSFKPEPPKELPPPDTFVGEVRIINIYAEPGGKTQKVDVWARRSFTNGPAKLVDGLDFGQASPWFKAPKSQSIVIVAAGDGADGKELGGVFGPKDGDKITGIFMRDASGPSTPSYWEASADPATTKDIPPPPAAGKGFVLLRANALMGHEPTLTESVGGRSFYVGDGSGQCLHQRVEDRGFSASILGGTQPVELELPPGAAKITLHKWPSNDGCKSPAVFEFSVDVAADKSTEVLIYTQDGKALLTLAVPHGV